MLKAVLFSVLIIGTLSGTVPAPIPEQNPNNATGSKDVAGGRYYGDYGYGHHPGHGWGYPWGGPHHDPPIIDDYICDLDATILVVTNADNNNDGGYGGNHRDDNYGDDRRHNGGYGGNNDGYGRGHDYDDKPNADRLKCSVIASDDNDSCTTCCQLAARRDRSIAKDDIIGFIVDNDQIDRNQNNRDNNGPYVIEFSEPNAILTFHVIAFASAVLLANLVSHTSVHSIITVTTEEVTERRQRSSQPILSELLKIPFYFQVCLVY
uniref:Uncharacterized protein n=1 Tax=Panagrolaimus sp. JU765 TaxID=591449 RepID=A0AC34Q2K4_9BILA